MCVMGRRRPGPSLERNKNANYSLLFHIPSVALNLHSGGLSLQREGHQVTLRVASSPEILSLPVVLPFSPFSQRKLPAAPSDHRRSQEPTIDPDRGWVLRMVRL